MVWINQHDILLCREALLVEPYQHKLGSRERGNAWDHISAELNGLIEVKFVVTKRSVRDRYNLLLENFRKRDRQNEKATGINVEETELDSLLDELSQKSHEAEHAHNDETSDKKKALENEKKAAEEIRLTAMESLGETRKRNDTSPSEQKAKKSRRSSSETIDYLREKSQREFELRERELQLKTDENAILRELILKDTNNASPSSMSSSQLPMLTQLQQLQQQQQAGLNRLEGMFSTFLEKFCK